MTQKPQFALEIKGLTVHYGSSPVLWDIHVSVPTGHCVGIIGPNGAGKTTLVKAVLGLVKGTSGSVLLLNRRLDRVRKRIAYVPQREVVDWDFPLTVYDLVEMGCYPRRGLFRSIRQEDRHAISRAIELLGLSSVARSQINQLSGGQQQRAFIARAIAQNADIYFLDEPFTGIDQVSEHILIDVLRSMCAEGKTVFVVHHDLLTAGAYFDWALFLNTRMVARGPFTQVCTEENLRMTYGENFTLINEVMKLSAAVSAGWSAYAR